MEASRGGAPVMHCGQEESETEQTDSHHRGVGGSHPPSGLAMLWVSPVSRWRASQPCWSQTGSRRGSHGPFVPQQWPCQHLPRGSLLPAGIFIYPLEESEVVAGFEAAVGSRRVTFQVQNRHRVQECCLQCSPSPGRLRRCASGKCHRAKGAAVGCSWPGGSGGRGKCGGV